MAEERTTIPSDWKMTTLSNVIEIIDGDRGSNYPQNDEFLSDGYCLFLNTKNVPGKTFSFKENKFINEEKNLKLGKGKLKRYDFVLTTRGTIGNFAFYSEKAPFENIRINSGMVILRTKEGILTNNFFKFYLRSYLFSNQAKSLSSGTAQPQLPIKDLKCFQIILPPCLEQDAIASVLSSLDDKIELLNEQSKTLETTSQTIFKEWFVNFNFPGATGKMIDSELGKIPQGWRCGKIKDLVDILSGFAFLSSDFSQNG
ncbi:MAG: restriction endonuclease subunit S, partial [Candidatus Oxydemutatoraceae bacterium WSBS_2016_MAG_OTU14]